MVMSGPFHALAALTAGKNPGTHSIADWVFYLQKFFS
jgi:hypothetical protein